MALCVYISFKQHVLCRTVGAILTHLPCHYTGVVGYSSEGGTGRGSSANGTNGTRAMGQMMRGSKRQGDATHLTCSPGNHGSRRGASAPFERQGSGRSLGVGSA